ncbi:hypothetical protein [Halosquirtibacter laminarini]|uniref:hypothetical protein n=1 Tax=Halosquirtibacter laminarini TaxID=3374600 RepID=UPI003748A999
MGILSTKLKATTKKKYNDLPNVVIIHTDQQSRWTLGSYGGSIIKTHLLILSEKKELYLIISIAMLEYVLPQEGVFFRDNI